MPDELLDKFNAAVGISDDDPLDQFNAALGDEPDPLDAFDSALNSVEAPVKRAGAVRFELDKLYETEARAARERGVDPDKVRAGLVRVTLEQGAGDPATYYRLFNILSQHAPEVGDWWQRVKDQPVFMDRIKEQALGQYLRWENTIGARDVSGTLSLAPGVEVSVDKARDAVRSSFMLSSILRHADIVGPDRFKIGGSFIRDIIRRQMDRIAEQPSAPGTDQARAAFDTLMKSTDEQLYDLVRAAHLHQAEDIRTPTERINATDFDQRMAFEASHVGRPISEVDYVKPLVTLLGPGWSKLISEGYREANARFVLANLGIVQTNTQAGVAPGVLVDGLNVAELTDVGAFGIIGRAVQEKKGFDKERVESEIERQYKFLVPTFKSLSRQYGRAGASKIINGRIADYQTMFAQQMAKMILSPPIEGPLTPFEESVRAKSPVAETLHGVLVDTVMGARQWARDLSQNLAEASPAIKENAQLQTFLRTGDIKLAEAVESPLDALQLTLRSTVDRQFTLPQALAQLSPMPGTRTLPETVLMKHPAYRGASPAEVKTLINTLTLDPIQEMRKEFAESVFSGGYEKEEERQLRLRDMAVGERPWSTPGFLTDLAQSSLFQLWTGVGELFFTTFEDPSMALGEAIGGAPVGGGALGTRRLARAATRNLLSVHTMRGALTNVFTNHPELAGKFKRFATEVLAEQPNQPLPTKSLFQDLAAQATTLDQTFRSRRRFDYSRAKSLAGVVEKLWTPLSERFTDHGFNFANLVNDVGLVDRLRIVGETITKSVGRPLKATRLLLSQEAFDTATDTISRITGGEELSTRTAKAVETLEQNLGRPTTLAEKLDVVPEPVQNVAGLIAAAESQVPFWEKMFSFSKLRNWFGKAQETKGLLRTADSIINDILDTAKSVTGAHREWEVKQARLNLVLDLIENKFKHRIESARQEHSAVSNNMRYDSDTPALRDQWLARAQELDIEMRGAEESVGALQVVRDRVLRHDSTKPWVTPNEFLALRGELTAADVKYLVKFHPELFPFAEQDLFQTIPTKKDPAKLESLAQNVKTREATIQSLFDRYEDINRDVARFDTERQKIQGAVQELDKMLAMPEGVWNSLDMPFSRKAFQTYISFLPKTLQQIYQRSSKALPQEFLELRQGTLRTVLNRIDQYIKQAADVEGFRRPGKYLSPEDQVNYLSQLRAAETQVFQGRKIPAASERPTLYGKELDLLGDMSALLRTDRAHPRLTNQRSALRSHLTIIEEQTKLGQRQLPELTKLAGEIDFAKTRLREAIDKHSFEKDRPSHVEITNAANLNQFFKLFEHGGLDAVARDRRQFLIAQQRGILDRAGLGQLRQFNPFLHQFAPQWLKSADYLNLARGFDYSQSAYLAKIRAMALERDKMSVDDKRTLDNILRGAATPDSDFRRKYPSIAASIDKIDPKSEVFNYSAKESQLWSQIFDIAEKSGFLSEQHRKLFESKDYDPMLFAALERPRMIREPSIRAMMNQGRTIQQRSELAARVAGEEFMMKRDIHNWRLLVDEGDRVVDRVFPTLSDMQNYARRQYGESTANKMIGDNAQGLTAFGDVWKIKEPLGTDFLRENEAVFGRTAEKRLLRMENTLRDTMLHSFFNSTRIYGGTVLEPEQLEAAARQYGNEIRASYVLVPNLPRSYGAWSGKFVHRHALGEFNRATRSFGQLKQLMEGMKEAWLQSGVKLPDNLFKPLSQFEQFFDRLNTFGRFSHILLNPRVYVSGIMFNFFNNYIISGKLADLKFLRDLNRASDMRAGAMQKFAADPDVGEMIRRGILPDTYFSPTHDPLKRIQQKIFGLDPKDMDRVRKTLRRREQLQDDLAGLDPTSERYQRVVRDIIALEQTVAEREGSWLRKIAKAASAVFLGDEDIQGVPRSQFNQSMKFLYSQTDNSFKYAWYKSLRRAGKSAEEAEWTIKTFAQNYNELPPIIQAIPSAIRSMVIAFPYELARTTMNNILYRPHRVGALAAMIATLNFVQMARGGVDWERYSAMMSAKGQKQTPEQIARFFTSSFTFNSRGEMVNHVDWLNWVPMFSAMQSRGFAANAYENILPEEKRGALGTLAGYGISFINQFIGQNPLYNFLGVANSGRDPITNRPLVSKQTHILDRMRVYADQLGRNLLPAYTHISNLNRSLEAPVDPRSGRLFHQRNPGSVLIRSLLGLSVEGTALSTIEANLDNTLATLGLPTPLLRRGREEVITDDDIATNIIYATADATTDNPIDSAIHSRRAMVMESYFKSIDDSLTPQERAEAEADMERRFKGERANLRGIELITDLTAKQRRQTLEALQTEAGPVFVFAGLPIDSQAAALSLMDRAGLSDDRLASFMAAMVFTERGRYQGESDAEKVERAINVLRNHNKVEHNARLETLIRDLETRILPRARASERREINRARRELPPAMGRERREARFGG